MVKIQEAILNNKIYSSQKKNTTEISNQFIKKEVIKSLLRDIQSLKNEKIVLAFSGGNDSSLILCLLKDLGIKNILAISVDLKKSPDLSNAKKITKYLNVKHKYFEISQKKLKKNLEELNQFKSQYNLKYGFGLSTYTILKEISKISKNIIMGSGLDELAGGFDYHVNPIMIKYNNQVKRELSTEGKELIKKIYENENNLLLSKHYSLTFSWQCFTNRYLKLYKDISLDILKINLLLPFFDIKIINIFNKISPLKKTSISESKIIIKKILEDYLPKKLIYRKKNG